MLMCFGLSAATRGSFQNPGIATIVEGKERHGVAKKSRENERNEKRKKKTWQCFQ